MAEGAEEADHGLRLVARLNYEKGVNVFVSGKGMVLGLHLVNPGYASAAIMPKTQKPIRKMSRYVANGLAVMANVVD